MIKLVSDMACVLFVTIFCLLTALLFLAAVYVNDGGISYGGAFCFGLIAFGAGFIVKTYG